MNRVSYFSHEETFIEEVERSTTLGENQKVEVLILYHQATRKCIQRFIDLTIESCINNDTVPCRKMLNQQGLRVRLSHYLCNGQKEGSQ